MVRLRTPQNRPVKSISALSGLPDQTHRLTVALPYRVVRKTHIIPLDTIFSTIPCFLKCLQNRHVTQYVKKFYTFITCRSY